MKINKIMNKIPKRKKIFSKSLVQLMKIINNSKIKIKILHKKNQQKILKNSKTYIPI